VEIHKLAHLFVERLTNIDFSYLDPDRGLLGESWLMDLELKGALDEQGMVLDFGIVKPLVKQFIDAHLDHCLVVPAKYQGTKTEMINEQLVLDFTLSNGMTISHVSIPAAVALIDTAEINTHSIKQYLEQSLKSVLPDNIEQITVNLYLEPQAGRHYQYSHGLRKHEGNCQRIAHGHRSKLEVTVEGQASIHWQDYWCDKWRDIYIGTDRHLLNETEHYYRFAYTAPQGDFELSLPKSQCYLIDTESTVENIAKHLATETAKLEPGKQVTVKAFEGVAKGAIASASVNPS
jgi:6-pyruvoyl-tetrahydropterin synthase